MNTILEYTNDEGRDSKDKFFFYLDRRSPFINANLLKLVFYTVREYKPDSFKDLSILVKQLSQLGMFRISREDFANNIVESLNDGYSYNEMNKVFCFYLYSMQRRWRKEHVCLFVNLDNSSEVQFTVDRYMGQVLRTWQSIVPYTVANHEDVFWNEHDDDYYTHEGIGNTDMVYLDYLDTYVSNDDLVHCVDIDEYRLEEDCHYDDNTNEYYADSDNIPEDNEDEHILEYNAGIPSYYIVNKQLVTEGISLNYLSLVLELEVEFNDESDKIEFSRELYDKSLNDSRYKALCKKDGSLSDYYGLEIATAPYCIESAKESFVSIANLAKLYGATGNKSGYGIHLHYNKNMLLSEFYGVAMLHDYRNLDNILKFSNRLNRETSCLHYNQYTGMNDVANNTSDRYNVLNKRSRSYENRMFQSSLREFTLIKNIEYMQSTREYVKHLLTIKDLEDISYQDYDGYLDYISEHSEKYSRVNQLIKEKNISKQYV